MKLTRLLFAAFLAAFLCIPAAIADHDKREQRHERDHRHDRDGRHDRDDRKHRKHRIHAAKLIGGEENPPVVSDGKGIFKAVFLGDRILFILAYARLGLDGNEVTQAHFHAANPGQNGGVVAFLCTNLGNAPPGTIVPDCPPSPSVVTGQVAAGDVLAGAANLAAGDLDGLKKLLVQGAIYVNVHTVEQPAGEIRGQVNPRKR